MSEILLIEDDIILSEEISLALEKWGFKVFTIKNFNSLIKDFINLKPKLVIMDINLPLYDGFYWCKKIREISKVPILFLSSRDSNMDMILAVNNGGDDYLTKPFSIDILVTKISAMMRRAYDYSHSNNIVYIKDILFDLEKGTITKNNKSIELTKNEIKILTLLTKNRYKIVSREKLMIALWESDEFINDNTLTVNINRLRNKIKDMGIVDLIKTKKGIGYIIDEN